MVSIEMKYLFTVKNIKFYYAGERHLFKGVWIWNGKKNVRIIPFNHFNNWTGRVED